MSYKTLGELVKIKGGKRLPKGSQLQSKPNSHPYIRVKDMGNKFITDHGLGYVPDDVIPSISRYIVNTNDVIISIVGTIGLVSIIDERFDNAPQTENCAKLSGLDCVDANYLYYFLKSPAGQQEIRKGAVGAVQEKLPLYSIEKLNLYWPNRLKREQVVNQLSTIDKKIDLNTQTNQTLEAMAQAIFKSWFVDFDPVKAKMQGKQPEGMDADTAALFPDKLVESELGLIPEGWVLSEIGDEVTVVGGGTPSKKNDDFWVDGHIHWTSPKDLSGVQDKVLLDTACKLTEAGLKKISSGLLPIDTVLLSSRAPVGYLALAKVPLAINQGYIAMKCEKALPPEFVLQWCVHHMDDIKQRASGSTFAEISKKNFKPISVIAPNEEVLIAYQKLVKPLYDAITSNVRQSEQLATLRDTLLPKLLSGELPLEQTEKLAEVS